jgi:CheY-like chemotaxis protein
MTVLLVDDDPDQLAVRCMLLEHYGFHAFCASDANSGLQLAREHRPGIAVVDLRLPTEDEGWNLIASLKEILPEVSIIVLSGVAGDGARHQQREHVDEWITKGSGAHLLLNTLNRLAAQSAT